MIAWLLFVALGAANLQAQPAEPILVERVADRAPLVLLGFVAFGADADLSRLERAAQALSANTGRIDDDPQGRLETMIVLMRVPRADGLRLYRDAVAGRYGRLQVEAMVIPVADMRGGIDPDKVRMTDPANIDED